MPKASSEEELPQICQTCLGSKDNIRMTRDVKGEPCKLCNRPFTVFRWQPAPGARRNATKICSSCSRRRAACQCCMLDLNYGLPLSLRDSVLKISADPGQTPVTQKYIAENSDSAETPQLIHDRSQDLLRKLSQKLVSAEPVAAVEAETDPDPKRAARNILKQLPLDGSIRSNHNAYSDLFIMGLEPDLNLDHLRSKLNGLGALNDLKAFKTARCAFASFTDNDQAVKAAGQLSQTNGLLTVNGNRLRFVWGPREVPLGSAKVQKIIGLVIRRFMKTGKLPGDSQETESATSSYKSAQPDYDD
ncbi:Pre-mRNA-splicing factor SLT11 [Wickerhamiella sorbophila]|uniref:Pre-mRNA-splicing factor SLT11 n=1 Tax=Wickerhamiella sorbophila TaxID=45607 RepID=A0A2T0FGM4_9ASCO|nr:Pre-mRNA-splicing factor SLT11 [Wickerhamiella sorbophila]PRT54099.1 Pre-mRNA-splicing factor SLT11 [Wickerhamiella sorbophila]